MLCRKKNSTDTHTHFPLPSSPLHATTPLRYNIALLLPDSIKDKRSSWENIKLAKVPPSPPLPNVRRKQKKGVLSCTYDYISQAYPLHIDPRASSYWSQMQPGARCTKEPLILLLMTAESRSVHTHTSRRAHLCTYTHCR